MSRTLKIPRIKLFFYKVYSPEFIHRFEYGEWGLGSAKYYYGAITPIKTNLGSVGYACGINKTYSQRGDEYLCLHIYFSCLSEEDYNALNGGTKNQSGSSNSSNNKTTVPKFPMNG